MLTNLCFVFINLLGQVYVGHFLSVKKKHDIVNIAQYHIQNLQSTPNLGV